MDVLEPLPRAAKRGRHTQDRQSASEHGNGNYGRGLVLRSRAAAPAGPGRH